MDTGKAIKVLVITARADIGGGPRHIATLMENKSPGIALYAAAPEQKPFYPLFRQHCRICVEVPFRKFSVVALIRLLHLVRREGIDIIHSHGAGGGVYGRLIKLFYRRGLVVHTFHGMHLGGRGLVKRMRLLAEKLLGRLTDHFVFVSASEMQSAEGLGLRKPNSSVILNGVDTEHYRRLYVDVEKKKRDLGIGPGRAVIGTVGRLSFPKAPEAGIRALSLLAQEKRDVVYLMVGDGEEMEKVRKEISDRGLEDRVLLLGSRDDVGEILKVMDLFILPSRGEGLPLAVLEAMASGIPVVATRVTGNVEAVLDGETGLLVDPGSAAGLSGAISYLLDNPELRRKMGARGQERAVEDFGQGRMAAETFAMYRRLMEETRPDWRGEMV